MGQYCSKHQPEISNIDLKIRRRNSSVYIYNDFVEIAIFDEEDEEKLEKIDFLSN